MVSFDEHEREEYEWLVKRPVCENCGEHIQEESAHMIPKFGLICDRCLEEMTIYID